jgi:K+-sensing histidine kinase KdpD
LIGATTGASAGILPKRSASWGIRPTAAILGVRDAGIGLQEAAPDDVFVAYKRAVSPVSYGGLGLGLHVVRTIARAHGGEVRLMQPPEGGTEVVVELPYDEATPA